MKMEESPLEVLSRAVSIVQNESKAKKRHSAPPMASSDSGIEEDIMAEYPEYSPKRSSSQPSKSSPAREYDSDDSSLKSPRLFHAVKYFRKSSPKSKHSVPPRPVSPRSISPRPLSPRSSSHRPSSPRQLSPEKLSPRQLSPRSMSPRQLSPRRISPPHMSPRDLSEYKRYPYYQPKSERDERIPELHEGVNYKRSTKRSAFTNEKHLKKIKVEDPDEDFDEKSIPVLDHCNKNRRFSPRHIGQSHLPSKPAVPVLNMTSERPIQLMPRYLHTYPPYPPLFILTDKPTNYSKLMETYDSIFAPKPPVLPPPLPAYTKCNCGDKNCVVMTPPVYSPPPPYREKNEAAEYSLPNVDEHFRKSLGDKYDIIKCQQANERPSSVDDHFAKALGTKWFKMEYGKKCTTKT